MAMKEGGEGVCQRTLVCEDQGVRVSLRVSVMSTTWGPRWWDVPSCWELDVDGEEIRSAKVGRARSSLCPSQRCVMMSIWSLTLKLGRRARNRVRVRVRVCVRDSKSTRGAKIEKRLSVSIGGSNIIEAHHAV